MSLRARSFAAPTLAIFAAIALLAALVSGYASRAILNSQQFADRAASALASDSVSAELGSRTADELVQSEPDLVAVRPVIEEIVAGLVSSGAFQDLFRLAVADLHRAIFEQDENTVTLTIADIGTTVRGALEAFAPKLAKQIDANAGASVLDYKPPAALIESAQALEDLKPLPWLLLVLGIGATALALWLAPDRRRTALTLGIAIGMGAVVAIVGLRAVMALVLDPIDVPDQREAGEAIWDAYLGDLRTALFLFAACGAVICAAASSLLRPVDTGEQLGRAWAFVVRVPDRPRLRVLRGVALLVAGVLIVLRRDAFLDLVALVIGLYVAYAGVAELMRLTIAPADEAAADERRGRAALVGTAVVALAILGAGALFIGTGGTNEPAPPIETEGCNGSIELCDRTVDSVAFPATHNAMSAATNPNWLFAQQEAGFGDQLRDGIRGLLIDAYYAQPTEDGVVKTDLSGTSTKGVAIEAELGSEAYDAALRIRDRLVDSEPTGSRGVYLCHGFCELGAISIDKAFGEIRDFLAANPEEVLVIVIEDYVDPEDIAAAAERTGLLDYVYNGSLDGPLPTLGEMVDSGGRVLMLAENDAGGVPWYHPAYEALVQETPYSFTRPAELTDEATLDATCEPNRGPADAPLFLINHWVDTSPAPKPSNARKVNARGPLLARIERCEQLRDLSANLIAVDFYREGDLFGVVAELNAARSQP